MPYTTNRNEVIQDLKKLILSKSDFSEIEALRMAKFWEEELYQTTVELGDGKKAFLESIRRIGKKAKHNKFEVKKIVDGFKSWIEKTEGLDE